MELTSAVSIDVLIKLEPWLDVEQEIYPMLIRHSAQVAPGRFQPDFHLIRQMAAHGDLVVFAGRKRGELIAYCIWYLSPDLSRAGEIVASQGPWWTEPEAREHRLGARLMKYSLEWLRSQGVSRAFPHYYETPGAPNLSSFMSSLGAKPYERTFVLDLQASPEEERP